MIAALPMYDRPETAAANDRLWAGIRDALRTAGHAAPRALTRDVDLWTLWQSPGLVLAQTCSLPFRARLHTRVTLVATPDYGVAACPPGFYRSLFVARADDPRGDIPRADAPVADAPVAIPPRPGDPPTTPPRTAAPGPPDPCGAGPRGRLAAFAGARLAVNEAHSHSGWAAAQAHLAAAGVVLRPVGPTGSHAASAEAVAAGRADLAAIDAVTWRLLARAEPRARRLRVLAATAPSPGLPLIAAAGADRTALRAALQAGLDALAPADRDRLGLRGFVDIPSAAYLALPLPPDPWADPTGEPP